MEQLQILILALDIILGASVLIVSIVLLIHFIIQKIKKKCIHRDSNHRLINIKKLDNRPNYR